MQGWRDHWLFTNGITGKVESSLPVSARNDWLVLGLRAARAAILVPIAEELFWRGWLPRLIANPDWEEVPLGHYTRLAFWATAALFAVEHGPYWEVGLLSGVIYSWWMIRTRSLGDLIVAHGVTNLCLSAYVLTTDRWEYWM